MQRLTLLPLIALAVTGCVSSPPISASLSPCHRLVPESWWQGVGHAPPPAQSPDPLAQLKAWIAFATAEAAQVEKADGRIADVKGLLDRCTERDAAAIKRSKRGFLGL